MTQQDVQVGIVLSPRRCELAEGPLSRLPAPESLLRFCTQRLASYAQEGGAEEANLLEGLFPLGGLQALLFGGPPLFSREPRRSLLKATEATE